MTEKLEIGFEIFDEVGGIRISRITLNGQQRFLTNHQESDFTNEGLDVNKVLDT